MRRWAFLLAIAIGFLYKASPCAAYEIGRFYYQGHTKDKVIALTFDDGPGPMTPDILATLKQYNARATFFMEGDQVPSYPAIAKQVAEAGMEIGNHTWSHFDFHKIKEHPEQVFVEELAKTEAAIEKATGVKTRVARMPHGYYNKTWLMPALKAHGYALVHWTFGTDWFLKKSAEQMAQEYLQNAHPGAVFLMHDGGRHREKTLNALKIILPQLAQQGYRFVAAEELFPDKR